MSALLETALRYVRGEELAAPVAVLPLEPGSKAPHHALGYREYDDRGRGVPGTSGVAWATLEPPQVEDWFTRWPSANLGVACGEVLLVVDVEGASHGHHWRGVLAHLLTAGTMRKTRAHATAGGGVHLFYRRPPGAAARGGGLIPGAEVKGRGSYLAVPPSTIYSAGGYAVLDPQPPACAPGWLLERLERPGARPPPRSRGLGGRPYTAYGRVALIRILERLRDTADGGQRHTAIFAAAAQLGRLERGGHIAASEVWRLEAVALALFPPPRSSADERGIERALERGRARGWGAS